MNCSSYPGILCVSSVQGLWLDVRFHPISQPFSGQYGLATILTAVRVVISRKCVIFSTCSMSKIETEQTLTDPTYTVPRSGARILL